MGLADVSETCDFLIIGGGSAGCIIARRLAEKSAGRIILLEAGRKDEGDPAAVDLFRLDDQTGDYAGASSRKPCREQARPEYARAKFWWRANHNDCAFLRPPIRISRNGRSAAPKAGALPTWPPIFIA